MPGHRYHVIVETAENVVVVDEFTDGYVVAWEEQGTGCPRGQMHLTPEFLSRLLLQLLGKFPSQKLPEIIGTFTRLFGTWQASGASAAAPGNGAAPRRATARSR